MAVLNTDALNFISRGLNLVFRATIKEWLWTWRLTFWHRSFTFNSNKSSTWCSTFSVYYPDVWLELNMFLAFSRPSSGAQWLQWQPLILPSYRGDSRAVFVVGPAGQFLILTFAYSSTCFGRFPAHHQELNDRSGSLWFYLRIVVIVVLCSWSGRPVSSLSWRLLTDQHVSGVFPPIIRSSMTAVAASGFTFVSWWQSCCVRGRAGRLDHEHSTTITTIRR